MHDALVLPHAVDTLRCPIGQRVRLNDAAKARVRRRGLPKLYNLGFDEARNCDIIGEVVAVGEKGRLRVKGEADQLCWHDVVNLLPISGYDVQGQSGKVRCI